MRQTGRTFCDEDGPFEDPQSVPKKRSCTIGHGVNKIFTIYSQK